MTGIGENEISKKTDERKQSLTGLILHGINDSDMKVTSGEIIDLVASDERFDKKSVANRFEELTKSRHIINRDGGLELSRSGRHLMAPHNIKIIFTIAIMSFVIIGAVYCLLQYRSLGGSDNESAVSILHMGIELIIGAVFLALTAILLNTTHQKWYIVPDKK